MNLARAWKRWWKRACCAHDRKEMRGGGDYVCRDCGYEGNWVEELADQIRGSRWGKP